MVNHGVFINSSLQSGIDGFVSFDVNFHEARSGASYVHRYNIQKTYPSQNVPHYANVMMHNNSK